MNSTIKNYYELCKPNVVLMMLITALVGSLLASKALASLSLIAFAMLGIGLCAASAAAINQIIDRKADANMNRTENRPIPQGEVSPVNRLCLCLYSLFKESNTTKYSHRRSCWSCSAITWMDSSYQFY